MYSSLAKSRNQRLDVTAEILKKMLSSDRVFHLLGSNLIEEWVNLQDHLRDRRTSISFAKKKRYLFATGTNVRMNEEFWKKNKKRRWVPIRPDKSINPRNSLSEPIGKCTAKSSRLIALGSSQRSADNPRRYYPSYLAGCDCCMVSVASGSSCDQRRSS